MIIVEANGLSMRPLLVTGDLVTITEYDNHTSIPFGTLVYATTIRQEKIIHRYIGVNLVKGDRVKELDQILSIEGLVTSKIKLNGEEQVLNGHWQRYSLGILNFLNQRKFVFIHRIAAGTIEIFGKVLK